jgi:hypothetical protein
MLVRTSPAVARWSASPDAALRSSSKARPAASEPERESGIGLTYVAITGAVAPDSCAWMWGADAVGGCPVSSARAYYHDAQHGWVGAAAAAWRRGSPVRRREDCYGGVGAGRATRGG